LSAACVAATKFLNGGRSLDSVLSRNVGLAHKFKTQLGDDSERLTRAMLQQSTHPDRGRA
jgi:hypothetical protein